MIVLATDPGLSGAVVLYGENVFEVRRDFQHHSEIAAAITELSPSATHGVIELVHSMPGQGVASMFAFGAAAGVALGSYESNGFSIHEPRMKPLIEVSPQKWQAFFWEISGAGHGPGARKNFDSKYFARKYLGPKAEPFLKRAKDHNTGDAMLLALWYQCHPGAQTAVRTKDRKFIASLEKKALKKAKALTARQS